ncbi:MAG: chemotaxis protein CheB [Panacagrimonas sp.]
MPKRKVDVSGPPPDAGIGVNEPDSAEFFAIVGVGASAGGLEAFTELLKALPADTGMAFVLIQHLAPSHPSALAEILARTTTMPVREMKEDQRQVQANHVYVIPPGRCMGIAGGWLQLTPREEIGQHRVIDHFFRALAEDRRHRAIGVVLSGTATDGTLGLEAIKAAGGVSFAQDDSARHDGMPHSAIASGCVDFVLSPTLIAREIARIGLHGYTAAAERTERPSDLDAVVQVLRESSGVDFSHYKLNTFSRRVHRRMLLQRMQSLGEYLSLLRRTPAEVDALYQDVLIGVTGFFRNPEAFDALKTQIFPRLIQQHRTRRDPVRMWTLGCSTGQEAYSLAMAFSEVAHSLGDTVHLQIFATDLNAVGIEKARAGTYSKVEIEDVSAERLRRFFVEAEGSYRIAKSIRELCIFSRHDVLSDPPFSRMDLISCRNLLIYLEPVLQQKILPALHYALNGGGCLWLGGSESAGSSRELFETEDSRNKIYLKKSPAGAPPPIPPKTFPALRSAVRRAAFAPVLSRPDGGADLQREADRVLSSRFAPPAVLVSAQLDIVQCRGDVSPYLGLAPGKASLNLLKMLRGNLLIAVHAAILRCGREQTAIREAGIDFRSSDMTHALNLEVIPIPQHGGGEGGFLILFETVTEPRVARTIASEPQAADAETKGLAQELLSTRDYLQSVIDQHEAAGERLQSAHEELQSAHEELQSANEELQSTNEELETSKEEIQSSSEELATVNDELNHRNLDLNRLNNDLVNLLDGVQMPVVILGPDLRVRRFTAAAASLLRLMPGDIGRPLAEIRIQLDPVADLQTLLDEALATDSEREREVRDSQGRWYSLRLRPYKTLDDRIDGVLLLLVDIDVLKRAHEYTLSIVATVREPLLVLDDALCVQTASRAFYEDFHVVAEESLNRPLSELGNGQWNIAILLELLTGVLAHGIEVQDFEVEHVFAHIGRKTMRLNARRLTHASQRGPLLLLAIEDITEQNVALKALRDSEERFRTLADNMAQLAWMADEKGHTFWFNRRWYDYTGTTLEQMQGWGWKTVHHPEYMDAVIERLQASWVSGETWEDTFPLRGRDGNYRWFLSHAVPIRDAAGQVRRWFGTHTDVTEQRQMANELRQNAADMSEADHRKNEFLAMLAHELRNPLAPIRNALEIIRATDGEPGAVQSASTMMQRQIGQMVRLVDDLLDVSRITRGTIELRREPVDLATILTQAVEAVRPLCLSRKQELNLSLPQAPVVLHADPTRLAQIVGNLLNNAGKFTGRGGRIQLGAECEDGEAVIRLRDNGVGISPEQLPRIFEMFMQADTTLERSGGGLGIGLTLVRNLVQLHGGTIEVSSAGIGHGSEFVLRLPVGNCQPSQPEQPVAAQPGTAGPLRILVVDDNRDSAESLAMLLQIRGHETHIVYDGLAAVEAAESFHPDVVLLDIGLPKLNGYEAASRIREQPWGKAMTLVALTGWGQDSARKQSADAGFNAHLVKPVNYGELTRLLAGVSKS